MSYKLPTGLPQDPKLTLVAGRAGLTRGVALAIWIALIDHAARARPRGSLKALKPDEIAAALDCAAAEVAAVAAALRHKGLITPDGAIAHWNRYQRLSTPRVRAHRARNEIDAHRARSRTSESMNETDTARHKRLRQEMAARRRHGAPAQADGA
ncbi:MAG: hypothetical protein KGL10_01410 [Alphaproteobacteria bacterium]|nr:hypothetical protein [Alphaproteobacteria bacterium]